MPTLLRVGPARRFTSNTVRDVDVRDKNLFIKRMPNHDEARAEEQGWRRIRGHFVLPRLYRRIRLPRATIMIYERWEPATGPRTFLDLINEGDPSAVSGYLTELVGAYRQAILSTARLVRPDMLQRKLYQDRAAPGGRLDRYYKDRSFDVAGVAVDELADYVLVINGRQRSFDWRGTLSWLAKWSSDTTPQWSAITQGDPTDVNLAVPFSLFDYDTAGRNALVGEFANFCWYTGFLGGYLVPRINPAAFTASPKTFDWIALNTPELHSTSADKDSRHLTIDLTWQPAEARRLANERYWDDLVVPVWTSLGAEDDINQALRPYLALRILGVFNLAELEALDALALIACLAECLADDFDARRLFTVGLA